jgi:pimeloyl-ACP methyl ester carboxylesterase
MEPRIQYAKTSDGVSIAYWALGEGAPLVYMPIPPFSHIQLEWEIAECREWYLRLAKRHKLIRYDGRGSGLSDRVVSDYSMEGQSRDLQAVVDSAGVDRFAIMVASHSAPVGISYVTQNPERVSHLILWCAVVRGHDYYTPQVEARLDLLRKDWDLYTETTAHALFGWSAGEFARRIAALIRDSITQEALLAEVAAARQFDATHLMDDLRVPALVLHRRQHPVLDVSVARGLASGIPGARLVLLEGASLAPYLGDTAAVVRAITEFLGEDESPESPVNAASSMLRTSSSPTSSATPR